jgi:hypothetical protein
VSRILDGVVNIGFGPLPVRTFRRHGSLKTRRQIQKTKIEGRHPSHRLQGVHRRRPDPGVQRARRAVGDSQGTRGHRSSGPIRKLW